MTVRDERAAIQEILERQAQAIQRKDADAVLATYADELVKFDLAPPLATSGAAARNRAELEGWFATWRGPIAFEPADMAVTVAESVAFAHGLLRIGGTKTDGEEVSVWARSTVCLARTGDGWRIVHEHHSVPFYMDGSYRAAIDLQP